VCVCVRERECVCVCVCVCVCACVCVRHTNESCYTQNCSNWCAVWRVTYTNASYHACEYVTSHIPMHYGTLTKESCRTYERIVSHMGLQHLLCHVLKRFIPCIGRSHVTRTYGPCDKYECSYHCVTWRVMYTNESCHVYA